MLSHSSSVNCHLVLLAGVIEQEAGMEDTWKDTHTILPCVIKAFVFMHFKLVLSENTLFPVTRANRIS